MKTNKLAQTATLALAGLFAAQPALADPIYGSINTLTYDGAYTGYISPVSISNNPAPVGGNPTVVSSGAVRMTNTTLGIRFMRRRMSIGLRAGGCDLLQRIRLARFVVRRGPAS